MKTSLQFAATALLSALAGGLVAAQGFGPAKIVVAPVTSELITPEATYVGTVIPTRRVLVGSTAEGEVVEYAAEAGTRVEAGAVLARLRPDATAAQRDASQAELELRRSELAELKNGSLPEEIKRARASLAAARAEETYRAWALQRAEDLFDKDTGTQEALNEARNFAARAVADREQAEEDLALILQGPRQERIQQAEARVRMQEAVVRRLEDDVERLTVKAPFTGYVIAESTEVGAWLLRGAPVVELIELDTVEVEVPVSEEHVTTVAVGQAVTVHVRAIPDEGFVGTVSAIVPQGDLRARTFPTRIRIENRIVDGQPLLRAGMFAEASLPAGAPRSGLTVQKDALVLGGPSPIVYMVVPGPDGQPGSFQAVPVPVRTGRSVDGRIAVEGELQAGALVVTEGNERLRPGQAVTYDPPQASGDGSDGR